MSKEEIKKTTKSTKKSVSKSDNKKVQKNTDIQEKNDDIVKIKKENIKPNELSKNEDFDWKIIRSI